MSIVRSAFALALAAALMTVPACAAPPPCMPQLEAGWLRLPPGRMPMLAGFARIENRCDAPAEVVAVASDAFADVSLHETRVVDGVSRMRPVASLPLAARGGAELKPGGLHLMLMHPHSALKVGQVVTVQFTLQDGRKMQGRFIVRPIGG